MNSQPSSGREFLQKYFNALLRLYLFFILFEVMHSTVPSAHSIFTSFSKNPVRWSGLQVTFCWPDVAKQFYLKTRNRGEWIEYHLLTLNWTEWLWQLYQEIYKDLAMLSRLYPRSVQDGSWLFASCSDPWSLTVTWYQVRKAESTTLRREYTVQSSGILSPWYTI